MHELIKAEYQGSAVTFQDDGWFNATGAATKYGKRPNDWLALPETARYLAVLCSRNEVGKTNFVKATRGGNTRKSGFGGTWLHPKLAVRFASWLDMEFSIWCDEQIDSILRGDAATTIEGEDFIELTADEIRTQSLGTVFPPRTGKAMLLTETGEYF